MRAFEELRATLRQQGRLSLTVKVTPRSPRSEVAGTLADGSLKLKIAAVPEDGKANAEVIRFLAEFFSVSRDQVRILSGATSTRKVVSIGR